MKRGKQVYKHSLRRGIQREIRHRLRPRHARDRYHESFALRPSFKQGVSYIGRRFRVDAELKQQFFFRISEKPFLRIHARHVDYFIEFNRIVVHKRVHFPTIFFACQIAGKVFYVRRAERQKFFFKRGEFFLASAGNEHLRAGSCNRFRKSLADSARRAAYKSIRHKRFSLFRG